MFTINTLYTVWVNLNGKRGLHNFSGVTPPESHYIHAIMACSINRLMVFYMWNYCSYAVIHTCEKHAKTNLLSTRLLFAFKTKQESKTKHKHIRVKKYVETNSNPCFQNGLFPVFKPPFQNRLFPVFKPPFQNRLFPVFKPPFQNRLFPVFKSPFQNRLFPVFKPPF